MRRIMRGFDAFLRRAYGIFEFCNDPACLLRIRVTRSAHLVPLPDGALPPGAEVLEIHLWNEHVPPMPEEGPDLAWAVQSQRMFLTSLRKLAHQIRQDPRLTSVRAIHGITLLFFPGDGSGGEKMFRRLGFTVLPHHSPLGHFGEFWENLYTWVIMWTFNPASLRARRLLKVRRGEIWMPVGDFVERFGRS